MLKITRQQLGKFINQVRYYGYNNVKQLKPCTSGINKCSNGYNPKFFFSNLFQQQFISKQLYKNQSKDNISNSDNEQSDDNQPNDKEQPKNNNQDNNNNSNNNNTDDNFNDDPDPKKTSYKLKTVPIKTSKFELTQAEQQYKPETNIFFSSLQPILPFSKVPCQMRTGNLQEVNHPLVYFLLNDSNEVYTVGILLERSVEKKLKKGLNKSNTAQADYQKESGVNEQVNAANLGNQINIEIIPKKMNYRVKLTEIEIKANGIFCKTIPYRDRSQNQKDKQINVEGELELIKIHINSIKKSISYEKIELFGELDMEKMNFREFTVEQYDQFIFQILGCIHKLYNRYMKESINVLLQVLLESRSYINRIILLRKHLEALDGVMDIVNKNFKMADDNMIKLHAQARARMSIEYIKQSYLTPPKEKEGSNFNQFNEHKQYAQYMSEHQKIVKKYNDSLQLIQDQPSREKVKKEIERFAQLDKHSSEYHKIYTYLDEVFSIPWKKYTAPFWNIDYAKQILDQEIFGLEKVKERIIQMIAVNQLKNLKVNQSKGFIILLYGPPGTGKTSIAKAIAASLKKTFRFISFAGVSDPYFIKGHRRTYVDSQPGVFVKELIKADTMNPIFILDEIDKLSKSSMGADPYYSLLEILNPEENTNFLDHYMDIKIDFSNVIFILTANDVLQMLEPLKNRLEMIEISAYIEEEKLQIGKKYIYPKALQLNGINNNLIQINDQVISTIIKNWCYHESGVRELKRTFETISRKFAVEILQKHPKLIEDLVKIQEVERKQQEELIEKQKQEQKKDQQQEQNQKQQQQTTQQIITESNQKDPQKLATNQSNQQQPKQGGDQSNPEQQQQQNNNANQQQDAPKQDKDKQQSTIQNEVDEKQQLDINFKTILTDEKIKELSIQPLDLTKQDSFDLLKKYLGTPPFDANMEERTYKVFPCGTVNILTVSGFVGHILTVECVYDLTNPDKKGMLTSSGNLKNILQESLTIAKINAFRFLNFQQIEKASQRNIHVHFMQGAVPKDGPSAGIAITTAFLSLALEKPVPANIAMTGELSLNGEVCKIGGLQSKLIASKTLKIDKVIVPYQNLGEAMEFSPLLLDGMILYFVKEYKQVYQIIFDEKRSPSELNDVTIIQNGKLLNNISYAQIPIPQQGMNHQNFNNVQIQ